MESFRGSLLGFGLVLLVRLVWLIILLASKFIFPWVSMVKDG